MEESLWTGQRLLAVLTGAIGLLAVFVPLWRALRLCCAARSATRVLPAAQLARGGSHGSGVEPLAALMARTLEQSLGVGASAGAPAALVLDASKQYTIGEYQTYYARPLSMYANLLPPIGLTGNAVGMLLLLVSKHVADAPLELAALGLAMISTIFALIGYALLEALQLRLYGRLLVALEQVNALCPVQGKPEPV